MDKPEAVMVGKPSSSHTLGQESLGTLTSSIQQLWSDRQASVDVPEVARIGHVLGSRTLGLHSMGTLPSSIHQHWTLQSTDNSAEERVLASRLLSPFGPVDGSEEREPDKAGVSDHTKNSTVHWSALQLPEEQNHDGLSALPRRTVSPGVEEEGKVKSSKPRKVSKEASDRSSKASVHSDSVPKSVNIAKPAQQRSSLAAGSLSFGSSLAPLSSANVNPFFLNPQLQQEYMIYMNHQQQHGTSSSNVALVSTVNDGSGDRQNQSPGESTVSQKATSSIQKNSLSQADVKSPREQITKSRRERHNSPTPPQVGSLGLSMASANGQKPIMLLNGPNENWMGSMLGGHSTSFASAMNPLYASMAAMGFSVEGPQEGSVCGPPTSHTNPPLSNNERDIIHGSCNINNSTYTMGSSSLPRPVQIVRAESPNTSRTIDESNLLAFSSAWPAMERRRSEQKNGRRSPSRSPMGFHPSSSQWNYPFQISFTSFVAQTLLDQYESYGYAFLDFYRQALDTFLMVVSAASKPSHPDGSPITPSSPTLLPMIGGEGGMEITFSGSGEYRKDGNSSSQLASHRVNEEDRSEGVQLSTRAPEATTYGHGTKDHRRKEGIYDKRHSDEKRHHRKDKRRHSRHKSIQKDGRSRRRSGRHCSRTCTEKRNSRRRSWSSSSSLSNDLSDCDLDEGQSNSPRREVSQSERRQQEQNSKRKPNDAKTEGTPSSTVSSLQLFLEALKQQLQFLSGETNAAMEKSDTGHQMLALFIDQLRYIWWQQQQWMMMLLTEDSNYPAEQHEVEVEDDEEEMEAQEESVASSSANTSESGKEIACPSAKPFQHYPFSTEGEKKREGQSKSNGMRTSHDCSSAYPLPISQLFQNAQGQVFSMPIQPSFSFSSCGNTGLPSAERIEQLKKYEQDRLPFLPSLAQSALPSQWVGGQPITDSSSPLSPSGKSGRDCSVEQSSDVPASLFPPLSRSTKTAQTVAHGVKMPPSYLQQRTDRKPHSISSEHDKTEEMKRELLLLQQQQLLQQKMELLDTAVNMMKQKSPLQCNKPTTESELKTSGTPLRANVSAPFEYRGETLPAVSPPVTQGGEVSHSPSSVPPGYTAHYFHNEHRQNTMLPRDSYRMVPMRCPESYSLNGHHCWGGAPSQYATCPSSIACPLPLAPLPPPLESAPPSASTVPYQAEGIPYMKNALPPYPPPISPVWYSGFPIPTVGEGNLLPLRGMASSGAPLSPSEYNLGYWHSGQNPVLWNMNNNMYNSSKCGSEAQNMMYIPSSMQADIPKNSTTPDDSDGTNPPIASKDTMPVNGKRQASSAEHGDKSTAVEHASKGQTHKAPTKPSAPERHSYARPSYTSSGDRTASIETDNEEDIIDDIEIVSGQQESVAWEVPSTAQRNKNKNFRFSDYEEVRRTRGIDRIPERRNSLDTEKRVTRHDASRKKNLLKLVSNSRHAAPPLYDVETDEEEDELTDWRSGEKIHRNPHPPRESHPPRGTSLSYKSRRGNNDGRHREDDEYEEQRALQREDSDSEDQEDMETVPMRFEYPQGRIHNGHQGRRVLRSLAHKNQERSQSYHYGTRRRVKKKIIHSKRDDSYLDEI